MKFILPRVFGLALIAGAASFLLFIVFKLLIGIAAIGLLFMIGKKLMRRSFAHDARMMNGDQSFGRMRQGFAQQYHNDVMPVHSFQRSSGIIPIN